MNCSAAVGATPPSGMLEVALDATRELVAALLAELAAVFPDAHFHLGTDEVNVPCLEASASVAAELAARGLPLDVEGVLLLVREWIQFAQEQLVGLGKVPVAWEEALDKYGPGASAWPPPSAAINDGLVPGSVIQIWKSPAWYDPRPASRSTPTRRASSAAASACSRAAGGT